MSPPLTAREAFALAGADFPIRAQSADSERRPSAA
jgi:hypothetical protein